MIVKELKRITSMPSSQTGDATLASYCCRQTKRSRLRSFRSYSDCINNVNIILCNLVCKVMDHLMRCYTLTIHSRTEVGSRLYHISAIGAIKVVKHTE